MNGTRFDCTQYSCVLHNSIAYNQNGSKKSDSTKLNRAQYILKFHKSYLYDKTTTVKSFSSIPERERPSVTLERTVVKKPRIRMGLFLMPSIQGPEGLRFWALLSP